MSTTLARPHHDAATYVDAVYRDGVAGLPQALSPEWADRLHADCRVLFEEARSYPEGTIGRGPNRYYFAVHPERLSGLVELITHPNLTAICEVALGPDYQIVEVAFDVPMPGAVDQPWHRDFPMPPETRDHRILSSLAFNVTTVDVMPDMAPFEIAPGTHWDSGDGFDHGMFVPPEATGRYHALAERRYPRRGDMSVRTPLTLHRGTANLSDRGRAVLVVGAVAAEQAAEGAADVHTITVTPGYYDSLPELARRHLRCTVVDRLTPIVQKHDIEGLVMG